MWTTLRAVGDKVTGLGINPLPMTKLKIAEIAQIL
jgi:hypothetical protein